MIARTFDDKKIRDILTHDSILPNISDTEDKDFPIPLDDDYHYLYAEGMVFILHPNMDDWEIHANVLPECRDKAYEAGQEAIAYGFNQLGASKLVAHIPQRYINVYQFALKSGFKEQSLIEDEHYLELERDAWAL